MSTDVEAGHLNEDTAMQGRSWTWGSSRKKLCWMEVPSSSKTLPPMWIILYSLQKLLSHLILTGDLVKQAWLSSSLPLYRWENWDSLSSLTRSLWSDKSQNRNLGLSIFKSSILSHTSRCFAINIGSSWNHISRWICFKKKKKRWGVDKIGP